MTSETLDYRKLREFFESIENNQDSDMVVQSSHLKMGGLFWMMSAYDILGLLDPTSDKYLTRQKESMDFVFKCYHPDSGGFSHNEKHSVHITATYYAILIAVIFGQFDRLDHDAVASFFASLQLPDGSFQGDDSGEADTRFSYCAISGLVLLRKLDLIDVSKALEYILRCESPEGAFGSIPESEPHAAYTFCCVGSLTILDRLDLIDSEKLGFWLAQRQISGKCGGFNGRPEKAPDVCYAWWIYATLTMLGHQQWISEPALKKFIVRCQDDELGGIADRPEDFPDIFHSFFGAAALSLQNDSHLLHINPVYAVSHQKVLSL